MKIMANMDLDPEEFRSVEVNKPRLVTKNAEAVGGARTDMASSSAVRRELGIGCADTFSLDSRGLRNCSPWNPQLHTPMPLPNKVDLLLFKISDTHISFLDSKVVCATWAPATPEVLTPEEAPSMI